MGISCRLWNNSALYLVSTQYLVVCFEYLLYLGFLLNCGNCYISPLHPSAYNAAYSAHNPCRPREARYLAFCWLPVKSHRPKPSRAISSVFQYIVLYTLHQPQYIVVSNWEMNLCILHKYLRYNILWLIMHSYTIYRHATRSARFAVSRALCIYHYSLPAACETCDTAQLSRALRISQHLPKCT